MSNILTEQVEVEANESKTLSFEIQMTGIETLDNRKPKVRFLIEDSETGLGISCPINFNHGVVSAIIPPLGDIFAENKLYEGKLEILFGTRLFEPARVGIKLMPKVEVVATSLKEEKVKTKEDDKFLEQFSVKLKKIT